MNPTPALDDAVKAALVDYILALADDEVVIGHRESEWTGLGPILEEDIAFSSIAQDELGHALTYYTLLEELGQGAPDDLAFLRPAEDFRSAQLCEMPRGDYAFSLVRGYLYDLAEAVRLEGLAASTYAPLAAVLTADEDEPTSIELSEILNYVRMADYGFGYAQTLDAARRWDELVGRP